MSVPTTNKVDTQPGPPKQVVGGTVTTAQPKHHIFVHGANTNSSKSIVEMGYAEMREMIMKWPNKSEVFVLKYGSIICSAACAATSISINHLVRKNLYLGSIGRATSFIGAGISPMVLTAIFHEATVVGKMLQYEQMTSCPVCAQVRSGAVQASFSVIQPTIVSIVLALTAVSRVKSFRMPNILKDPKGTFVYAKDLFKPLVSMRLPIYAACQFFFGMGLTYYEQDQYFRTVIPQLQYRKLNTTTTSPTPTPTEVKE